MNQENDINYSDNINKFKLKTNSVKDSNGDIIESSVYLDSEIPMNRVGETPELTKEEMEKMKETLSTEIDKTTKSVPYDDLIEIAVKNLSDSVREHAKKEIRRRIISGEVKYKYGDEINLEAVANQIIYDLEKTRIDYLRSVAKSKGNVR